MRILGRIMYLPRKVHDCLTHCLAEKKCFTSWTWCKLAMLSYILIWLVGVVFVFITIPLYLYQIT